MTTKTSTEAIRIVASVALMVFAGEALVMVILDQAPKLPLFVEALVDASLLTLLLAPTFYLALYRPLRQEIDQRQVAEQHVKDALAEAKKLNAELLDTQEQLVVCEKSVAMGHLAAGVAHEINNPIGYVGSNITSLSRYLGKLFNLLDTYEASHDLVQADATRFAALQQLRQEIDVDFLKSDINDLLIESTDGLDRVKRIARDLKDFSRVDDGRWAPADINAELERTLNMVHNELKYHVEVVRQFGALPPVECVAQQINQVFLNLLVNAGQAIASKGTITVTTTTDGEFARVSICDTGCGMSQEQLKKAFEPFYTTKPRGVGTGLGLSVSIGIIERHHGKIEVTSQPGVGSTFHVLLPFKQPATAPEEAIGATARAKLAERLPV